MKNLLLLVLLLISKPLLSQAEGDRIIAIVGNHIILQSDLNFQLYNYMTQNNISQLNEAVIQLVFQNMLTEKLILAKADQDSIYISQEEIQKQTDARLKELVNQFGSEKNLENTYGITIARIKKILREQLETSMKLNKVKQKKFGYGITVTRPEVIKFYNEYKDSLPPVPESFELYQIVRIPKITEDAKYQARKKAEQLLDSLKKGADFSELAKKYSDDSLSAIKGGNLGKAKKGTFVKEFEDAAFLLQPGEISGIVETEFGYHIIKLLERTGDFITTQHILIKFPRFESADFAEINFLRELKNMVLNKEATFQELAVIHSQDPASAKDSGYIGKISLSQLDSLEILALKDLSPGEISEPVKVGDSRYYGYHLYLVKERFPEHMATLETDYALIEQYALQYKEQKAIADWVEELKKTIYVEIKM
ncbi:MAG: peptidylprolyl isomerase [Ignavibacteria bacterium]|nr:peptidylprolyl isomerase [Ignavibacteria bacterium]